MASWPATDPFRWLHIAALVAGAFVACIVMVSRANDEDGRPPPVVLAWVAALLTSFGGAGFLAMQVFGFSERWSLVTAFVFSVTSVTLLCLLALRARSDAEKRRAYSNVVGALADVVSPITPGGAGKVLTATTRPKLTLVATSRHRQGLAPGARVVVTRFNDDRAEVALMGAPAGDQPEAHERSAGDIQPRRVQR